MITAVLAVIIGWSRRTKNYGTVMIAECQYCDNTFENRLVRYRTWFYLFFIPVLPISRARYSLVCPICNIGLDVSREEARILQQHQLTLLAYLYGELTDEGYIQSSRHLKHEISILHGRDRSIPINPQDLRLAGAAEDMQEAAERELDTHLTGLPGVN